MASLPGHVILLWKLGNIILLGKYKISKKIKYTKTFQNALSPVNCKCVYRDIVKCPGFGGSESHYFVGKHSLALAQKCTDAQTPVCTMQHHLAGIGF